MTLDTTPSAAERTRSLERLLDVIRARVAQEQGVSLQDLISAASSAGLSASEAPAAILQLERAGKITIDWQRRVRLASS